MTPACSTDSFKQAPIFYEDDYLLIFNKPAGMLVHPTVSESGATLCDAAARHYAGRGLSCGLHPVSRLDRNTSGLVIFAKEPVLQYWLSLPEYHLVKEYLAVAGGRAAQLPESGVIDAPIARKSGSIIERCVDYERGKEARTLYRVLRRYEGRALLALRLCTGRTHQIRVHLAHLGCPLVGDNLYGTLGPQSRHALHAYKLSFIHPVSDKPLAVSCALPEDMRRLLK